MKKFIVFLMSFVIALSVPSLVFAEEYGAEFPSYVPYSGGAYIEVQSSLGRGSFVFPSEYKESTFGFSGSGYNLCNLSKSTVSGYFITSSGAEYSCRFSSFSTAQYYYSSDTFSRWTDLTVSGIYNTNVSFIDDKAERSNILDLFSYDIYKYAVVSLLLILLICVIILVWRSHGAY